MTYKQSLKKLERTPWITPSDVVLAFEEREALNSVIMARTLRYRLIREITREEFLAQLEENRKRSTFVAATARVEGSRVCVSTVVDVDSPGPEYRFFYAAECV